MPTPEAILRYGIVASDYAGITPVADSLTITPYPSGLVRVEQIYTCPNEHVTAARATLGAGEDMPDVDDDPSIDGLKIFPAPQERRNGSITEFTVTGYGRVLTGLQGVVLRQELTKFAILQYTTWSIAGEIVLPKDTAITLETLGLDEDLFTPFGFSFLTPTYQVLSFSEVDSLTAVTTLSNVTINGSTYQIAVQPLIPRRQYQVSYGVTGAPAEGTINFWINDPKVFISSFRSYGDFVEIQIVTERQGTTPEVV